MIRLVGEDLCCVRGGRTVFEGLSFSVARGEALIVVGRNGAGKSSLLRLIAGLVHAERGRLALEGGDGERTIGEQCHYAGHLDALKSSLSVFENIAFWHALAERKAASPHAALEAFAIAHLGDLPAAYLSAGQRRRLALARLLVNDRPIWLLDEPTAALDAPTQERLRAVMAAHLARGGIILAATHGPLGLERAAVLDIVPAGEGQAV